MSLIAGMQDFVGERLSLLTPVDRAWQPTDFLPDLTAEDWAERLARFRESAQGLSDDVLVVLVGNMVTEEALPNYSIRLSNIALDVSGSDDTPWACWLRGWTAEENRHGDLLNAFLRLTGRVDMRAVERTIHHLIREGFNPKTEGDNVSGLVYAAFQERATRITHGNVGRLALEQGSDSLARICRRIAGDESRHESFYTKVVGRIMQQDPEGGVLACRTVLRGMIIMPGRNMADGRTPDLYDNFAAVAQRTGTYTALDYAQIIDHLMKTWGIAGLSLTGKAAKAQDYLCQQAEKYERHADEITASLADQPVVPFAWLGRTTRRTSTSFGSAAQERAATL